MDQGGIKNLRVWDKSHKLVLSIYQATERFPERELNCLTNQMRRAAVSTCANIAEGYRKGKKEFGRFLEISQGSLEETRYYLLLSHDLRYIDTNTFTRLDDLSNEIGRMLYGLMKRIRATASN